MTPNFRTVLMITGVLLLALGGQVAADSTNIANAPNQVCPILIGSSLPKITLLDLEGNRVELNKVIAEKPSVLIYFRGGW